MGARGELYCYKSSLDQIPVVDRLRSQETKETDIETRTSTKNRVTNMRARNTRIYRLVGFCVATRLQAACYGAIPSAIFHLRESIP